MQTLYSKEETNQVFDFNQSVYSTNFKTHDFNFKKENDVDLISKEIFSEEEESSLYTALNEAIDISLQNLEWTEPLSWQK